MPEDLVDDNSAFPTPVTVPTDLDPRNAASVRVPFKTLADRTAYHEEQLNVAVPGHTINLTPGVANSTPGFSGEGWVYRNTLGEDGGANTVSPNSELIWDLHELLPVGAVLTQIDAMVIPGTVRPIGSRMKINLWTSTPNYSLPSVGASNIEFTFEDTTGTAALKVLSANAGSVLGTLPYTIVEGERAHFGVQARVDGGGPMAIADICHYVRITFTAPEVRRSF